ncbi:hypothetical protein SMACR_01617 [Sordaria macrospora]|uniref:WGS project CABT00000000 data, contig 2.4 n=2 Tax=Sordaria macrospora TaxID=5147 RepID=F7VRB8_SORMK|nr:uncharacterized protein SMAC_01617 [Sordaria macrospora k-hell]KAA8635277.1 hypothetical protein SMACR_01617 [Sordaria macrospora]KAH7634730.1 hypothetical protein B0T09DRAFT_11107 [Sordaria sp. MPI-SDFR-AT-0083]WPJ58494.1 hypothetical protein SMAC4_01617 [Sordaria macrospora]CCC08053.1 unnamed protein product [Sordaria macrospora k-hell]
MGDGQNQMTAATATPQAPSLESFPNEIKLHILSFLEAPHITNLQLVSRAFRDLARDNSFWRSRCLQQSSFLESLERRRAFGRLATQGLGETFHMQHDGSATGTIWQDAYPSPDSSSTNTPGSGSWATLTTPTILKSFRASSKKEQMRIMANWDPCFPTERVSWYEEYIQRHAPVAINWLPLPHARGAKSEYVEARGVALYRPDSPRIEQGFEGGARSAADETLLAVSPLDDGSVCIWDVNGTRGRKGAILATSAPGLLLINGPGADNSKRSQRVDSGVTECVSVDSSLHRAFFAVQNHIIEVDLQRLSVVDFESFPWSITALSSADPRVPLTVGTNLELHLHDYRSRRRFRNAPEDDQVDFNLTDAQARYERGIRNIFSDEPAGSWTSLAQPGPLSILHVPRPGQQAELSDDIYVAGRFSHILHYDRRNLSRIRGSINSKARLCSMTSLPFPFSKRHSELRRKGELTLEEVEASKSVQGGRTLIAGGDYNMKGSLEIYGLAPPDSDKTLMGDLDDFAYQNRQSASGSKVLSVANHGTRVVFSDGSGYIKWFERDCFTEVRRCRIGHSEQAQGPSIFASMPGSSDIARKLLPTRAGEAKDKINDNDLLFWTGERLGLLNFSARPGFTVEEFEEEVEAVNNETRAQEREERDYTETMRRALQRHADDVMFTRHFGLGNGSLR